jgi:hypothetical protein
MVPSQSPNSDVTSVDGAIDFSGGVNSLKVTTIQSQQNPNGLSRNELSWLINGSVRDGGITPRPGWKPLKRLGSGSFAYQGAYLYRPIDGSDPYFIALIGGKAYKASVDGDDLIDLFSTAYQLSVGDQPSITLKNIGLTPGDTIPVAPDIQSFWGLPASFVAPAANGSIKFNTNGNISGVIGQTILFYGTMSIQAVSFAFDTPSLSWRATLTLLNESYPAGTLVNTTPFTNPHGPPISGTLNNFIPGMTFSPFTAPAIGSTVNVVFIFPVATRIGFGNVFFTNDTQILEFNIGQNLLPGHIGGETVTYDSGTNQLIDTISGVMSLQDARFANGMWCEKSLTFNSGDPVPAGPVFKFDCTAVPGWVFDAFTAVSGFATLIGRQPNLHPEVGLDIGANLNFWFGGALVTNVNNTTFDKFGTNRPFFCQGNEFLVIQAGDYTSLPLFWDGAVLRKSIGINNNAVAPGTPGVNELPAGGPMDYYLNRLWYAQVGIFNAGDISGGGSGTAQYNFRDSILNVTENPLVLGGDGFSTPADEGPITALAHNANQDAALGQGKLFSFTGKGAHQLSVPVTRADWIAANSQNQPLLVPVQLANGTASDRSVVAVNGDLFYQSPQADTRTMKTAVRYFSEWGNLPISSNVNRVNQFSNQALLEFATGIYFGNRLMMSALPLLTPQGCIHQALTVLDFESISSFGANLTPTWQGMYEGLDILQLFTGIFSGRERAFAITVSRVDFSIQLWEITKEDKFDNTDSRIQMITEFPAFTWGNEFSLKQQVSAEIWIDRLYGEVTFLMEYRPDGESCWQKWHEWKVCAPKNSCENTGPDPCTGLVKAICYPLTTFGESYRQTMTLPTPPKACAGTSGRPSYVNFQCQPRLTVRGFCRIRGLLLHAAPIERKLFTGKVC